MALNMPLKWICLWHKTVKVIIKIMQKNFFSVQKCWHSKTLSHTTILKLLWETHFLSQISLFYVLFIKVENNDACKNQKPDYARDDMVPIILLKPQNKKTKDHSEYRHSKRKVRDDFLLLQNVNYIPQEKCI